MNEPLISVIVPVYNCETTLETAVRSILAQTHRNLEVIVVDDASTDGTKSVAERLMAEDSRVRVFNAPSDPERFDERLGRNVNAGYSARNLGFEHARGAYLTFQDADDASLPNRIETQYALLAEFGAVHCTVDWFRFDERRLGKTLDVAAYPRRPAYGPENLYAMSQRSKGLAAKLSPALNRAIPFRWKRLRGMGKLFFGSLENYPGAGNSPLFRREVIEQVRFRKLADRVWPSFMGRGADKDFNFQVAETFRKSYVFRIPLYLWRVREENPPYAGKDIIFKS